MELSRPNPPEDVEAFQPIVLSRIVVEVFGCKGLGAIYTSRKTKAIDVEEGNCTAQFSWLQWSHDKEV
jgi:hypothetical protein